ncbi:monocarboxylate transporter 12-like isoform X1 [Argiope bruennichi]|uniref:monocarboxylate transporter 12-like isoform X1 n=1 Tax=Argiope bruennichi TaxID=94029 RepID=UPI0024956852|nr:monocarboxylate transporter 12-like isoform X1 [Argiope bruennichi]
MDASSFKARVRAGSLQAELYWPERKMFRVSSSGTMKGVPEEEEEEDDEGEVWSSRTTPPPKLPCTLVQQIEEDGEIWEAMIPEPPDGGWGWVIVMASFMCNVVVDGIAYSFGIFLVPFVNYYKSSKGKTAWVGSLLAGCYLIAGPVVSALTNKFGCRPVTIAGSIISCIAFLLSIAAPTVDVLMVTYGIMAGIGFGLIYLPAIVSVGYYFSTKRAFATGIAVCGSGMGAFVFAPLTQLLLDAYSWQGAMLIMAGLALNCSVFGALMRPLEAPAFKTELNGKPSLLSDKGKADSGLELVPEDGVPLINTEPGVQSTLNLDQMPRMSLSPMDANEDHLRKSIDVVPGLTVTSVTPSASSQKIDGTSMGTLCEEKGPPKATMKVCHSQINVKDLQHRRFTMPATMPASTNVLCPTANNNYAAQGAGRVDSWTPARRQQRRMSSRKDLVRPLYRKDIFYSGSIVNLPQYRQSKADIRCYISSVTTIPQPSDDEEDDAPKNIKSKPKSKFRCPRLPKSMTDTLKEALDFSLLTEPAFLLACIANIFGMLGFYVPFVYIADSSVEKGIGQEAAAFLLSVIGITNLVGRLIFGWVVDRFNFKALDVNNMCLAVSGISIMVTPFCLSYASIVAVCTFFSIFVSAYISLTSIILVEMVGLDRLTNSFGLLSLFRGASSILGPPLAGSIYDWTGSYDIPFFLAGGLLIFSGVCTFFVPWLQRRSKINIQFTVDDADSGRPESEPTTSL